MKARKVVSGATAVVLALSGVMFFAGTASAEEEVPPAVTEVVEETPAEAVPEPVVEVVPPAPEVVVEVEPEPVVEVAPAAEAVAEKSSSQEVAPLTQPEMICDEAGYEAKVDWDGDGNPTVNAPEGFLIDSYCVKAGTTKHIVPVTPPAASVEIDHPEKDSVSHYQVRLVPIPEDDEPNCTTVTGSVVLTGDGVFTVTGEWDTESLAVPFSGTLADIGTVLDIQASPIQYVGLHIDTAQGTIVFEEEPSYGGNLWSTSAWDGVGAGMGYAAFGSIEEFIAQNGDVVVTGIRLLYTHPEASSTTVESFIIGCTEYTFDPTIETPLPAQFNIEPTAADCGVAGSLMFVPGVFEHVTLSISPAYDGPGTYVISADTEEGYEFPDGTTHKEREVTVPEALEYQSSDPESDCYEAPPVVVPLEMPVIEDVCGTEDDFVEIPVDSEDRVVYTWQSDDIESEEYDDIRATVQPGYVVETVPAGWVSVGEGVYLYEVSFSDEACPGTTTPPAPKPGTPAALAVTGSDTSMLVPIAGGLTVALGIVLMLMRRFAQR